MTVHNTNTEFASAGIHQGVLKGRAIRAYGVNQSSDD
jgi:hypothetical protein